MIDSFMPILGTCIVIGMPIVTIFILVKIVGLFLPDNKIPLLGDKVDDKKLASIKYEECCAINCSGASRKMYTYKFYWGQYIEHTSTQMTTYEGQPWYEQDTYYVFQAEGIIHTKICQNCLQQNLRTEIRDIRSQLGEKSSHLNDFVDYLLAPIKDQFSDLGSCIVFFLFLPIWIILLPFLIVIYLVMAIYGQFAAIVDERNEKTKLRKKLGKFTKALNNPSLMNDATIYQTGIRLAGEFCKGNASYYRSSFNERVTSCNAFHEYEKYSYSAGEYFGVKRY